MGDPFRVGLSPSTDICPGVLATLVPSAIERRPRCGLFGGVFAALRNYGQGRFNSIERLRSGAVQPLQNNFPINRSVIPY
jgi:hypothetical protein